MGNRLSGAGRAVQCLGGLGGVRSLSEVHELSAINQEARDAGAFLVLYWGMRLLEETDVQPGGFYDTLLEVSAEWGG